MPSGFIVRVALVVSTVLASWLGMQAAHELGHVTAAWLTGGTVVNVALHPLGVSRTDLGRNPEPLLVVWAGPVLGTALPVIFWLGARAWGWSCAFLARFFAGFCLAANGAYVGVGSIHGLADAGVMIAHGSSRWQLVVFGVAALAGGLTLWHGQGRELGLGRRSVPAGALRASLVALGLFTLIGIIIGE